MSRSYRILQVDAFTTIPLEGNSCAVVLDADDLDDERKLAIAREMYLSETSFVRRSQIADLGARYFTPAEEIPMAGHPTIATIHALIEEGRIEVPVPSTPRRDPATGADTGAGRRTALTLELPAGIIGIEVERDAKSPRITMTQLAPKWGKTHDPAEVMPAFSLTTDDLLPGAPIETVSTGTPQLMVPLGSLDALRRARLDRERYLALREAGDFFSPHLFVVEGATPEGDTFARHFGVPPDTFEDPFTGSATGGMAAYLWRHGRIVGPRFVAEQGHWMARPGRADVEVVGPPDAIEAVRVSGRAVTVLRGELTI